MQSSTQCIETTNSLFERIIQSTSILTNFNQGCPLVIATTINSLP